MHFSEVSRFFRGSRDVLAMLDAIQDEVHAGGQIITQCEIAQIRNAFDQRWVGSDLSLRTTFGLLQTGEINDILDQSKAEMAKLDETDLGGNQ